MDNCQCAACNRKRMLESNGTYDIEIKISEEDKKELNRIVNNLKKKR